jgi:serine/threonine protein kinase
MTSKRVASSDVSATDLIVEDLEGVPTQKGMKIPDRKPLDAAKALQSNRRVMAKSRTDEPLAPPKQPGKKRGKLLWQQGRLIGTGGFGKVYVGLDGNTGTLVAAKEFDISAAAGDRQQKPAQLESLQREIRFMKSLRHKNIVKYYGADRKGTLFYIFMEFIPGGSLKSILDQFGALHDRLAASYTRQILRGLQYLHRHGIIHRDIKAANVLVNIDGIVKLGDFGSAQLLTEAKGTHGTPFWMAPEVIRGEAVGWQADIWSLGCVVIEMLTGQNPFIEHGNSSEVLSYIATDMQPVTVSPLINNPFARSFLERCLMRNPADRPSVDELLRHDFVAISGRRAGSAESGISTSSSIVSMRLEGGDEESADLDARSRVSGGLPEVTEIAIDSDMSSEDIDEPLQDDVRSALVSRMLSFAREARANLPNVANGNGSSVFPTDTTNPLTTAASNNGFGPAGVIVNFGDAVPASGPADDTASVVNYIQQNMEVDRNSGVEMDIELDSSSPRIGVDERLARVRSSESSLSAAGGNRCLSTMQRLQLGVTLLLVAVIGALAALLVLKS